MLFEDILTGKKAIKEILSNSDTPEQRAQLAADLIITGKPVLENRQFNKDEAINLQQLVVTLGIDSIDLLKLIFQLKNDGKFNAQWTGVITDCKEIMEMINEILRTKNLTSTENTLEEDVSEKENDTDGV